MTAQPRTVHRATSGPLVGRAAALDRVRPVLPGPSRPGGALLVTGPAGIGKTALLEAAGEAARADGLTVLSTDGDTASGPALGRALRPLRRHTSGLDRAHRRALDEVLSGAAPSSSPLLLASAVLALLRAAGADRPVLLVVDDLPGVDEASATVLGVVARRLAGSPVGFLGAMRTGGGTGLPEHELAPLDDDAAARLLHDRYPRLAPPVVRRLVAEAAGHPLALRELPTALSGPQRAGLRALPAVLPLPEGLRDLFGPDVAGLPHATRWSLLLAALDGTGDPVLDDLAPAERAGLVAVDRPAAHLAFRHPLVRPTVVNLAAPSERRRAHRALADACADDPARRARHLAEAADGPDEETAAVVEDAALRALRRGDGDGAVAGLLHAAALSPTGAERGRRLAEAARAAAGVTGDLGQVEPFLAEARRADPTGGTSPAATVASASLLLHRDGDVAGAHRLLVAAEADEMAGDDVHDDAADLALEVGLHGGLRVPPVRRGTTHLLLTVLSDPARATADDVDRLDRAIDRLGDETDPRRIVRVAAAALAVDRGAACRAPLRRVAASRAVTPALRALALLCVDDYLTGRWDECLQLAREGAELGTTHGHHLLAAPLRLVEALVAAARGDRDTTAALTGRVDAWARPRADRVLGRAVHRVSALAALADGDPEHAFRCASAVSAAGTLAPHPSAVAVAGDLVEAAARSGRTGGAARHARAMRQAPLASVSPRFAMVAAGAAAVAASPDAAAAALFEEALATPGAERWAFDRARVQLAYGEHLRRSREPATARPHLGAALGTFRRLSAEPWTARARDELRAVGARPDGPPTPPPPRRPSPTPEELEAAVLAASGLTNKQIAGRLRLSHRTVSARLYQVFPKLGVVSRAGLRDALREREPSGDSGAVGA